MKDRVQREKAKKKNSWEAIQAKPLKKKSNKKDGQEKKKKNKFLGDVALGGKRSMRETLPERAGTIQSCVEFLWALNIYCTSPITRLLLFTLALLR